MRISATVIRAGETAFPLLVAALAMLASVSSVGATTGDELCDANRSTATTCVITRIQTITNGSALIFTKPNVLVCGTTNSPQACNGASAQPGRVRFEPHCSLNPSRQCSTLNCRPERNEGVCVRTGSFTFLVDGTLTLEAGSEVSAASDTKQGDVIGPPAGTIVVNATDVVIKGTVHAQSRNNVQGVLQAGNAGTIEINAERSLVVEPAGLVDASTLKGGCGGTVRIGGGTVPQSVTLAGTVTAAGATLGGEIRVTAGQLQADGPIEASNTNSNVNNRPQCLNGEGGGVIILKGGQVQFGGSAKARGEQTVGGIVRLEGETRVTVDSTRDPAIDVFGGDDFGSESGGDVFLVATAGDISILRGRIVADALVSTTIDGRFGSDAGSFTIDATGPRRCVNTNAPCASDLNCGGPELCRFAGGNVLIQAPASISAQAGVDRDGCVGLEFGVCTIFGTGNVTVGGDVRVDGGGLEGFGGLLEVDAGRDLVIGPGVLSADGADAGNIVLRSGITPGGTEGGGGALRLASGANVHADPLLEDGSGGAVEIEGCNVTVATGARASAGGDGALDVTAHERVIVEPLARLLANPDGEVNLRYRRTATIAPNAQISPKAFTTRVATLDPCPGCGNGVTEPSTFPPEQCDGSGTCAGAGLVCVDQGNPGECTCIATCGVVPGIQPGEECDGGNLGGQTCASMGFLRGTLTCNADCTVNTDACVLAECGDGIIGPGEQCDGANFGGLTCAGLGFTGGQVACASDCSAVVTFPHCSNDTPRSCASSADCAPPGTCVAGCVQCGNGFLDQGRCSGNRTQPCTSNAQCGAGQACLGIEECDEGGANGETPNHCRDDCRLPRCGDFVVDFAHCSGNVNLACTTAATECEVGQACVPGELCDAGPNNGADRPCTNQCVPARCGDGTLCSDPSCATGPGGGPEQCDDGNQQDDDGCDTACALPQCGDGIRNPGEQCDDGNQQNDDGCDVNCTTPRCGNGIVNQGEQCDPPSACCLASCLLRVCDDGNPCTDDDCDPATGCINDPAAGRVCTDENACTTGDVCSAAGACTGAEVPCESPDPACIVAICDPDRGCELSRRHGYGALLCLPFEELDEDVFALEAALGRPKTKKLQRFVAKAMKKTASAINVGPGKGAIRRLKAADKQLQRFNKTVMRLEPRMGQEAAEALRAEASALSDEILVAIQELST